ncbi:AN1-type zinc finger protein 3 isoform X1 [Gadus morhua]|uniref:AN1-type zinc finger protein 3 isoform X1 n=1 Tax=Gadus morhua TaxID=8049 RepID=UPI0011B42F50|nr:AN1-type zinc finger protein 3 isoform X1 [Gadus morhua]
MIFSLDGCFGIGLDLSQFNPYVSKMGVIVFGAPFSTKGWEYNYFFHHLRLGSSKTMNMCSKCFADIQKKQPEEDCTPQPIQSSGSSQSPVFSSETSSSSSQSLLSSLPSSSEQLSTEESSSTCPAAREGPSSTETAQGTLCTPTKRPRESASGSESEATPEKRPRTEGKEDAGEEPPRGGPKQKNRRRCYSCQTKLELVQQELGSCRCGYVFCMLHRLPEQHNCLFDHLGRGREEAVLKMVKLDRKVGRSCQRIGEECS